MSIRTPSRTGSPEASPESIANSPDRHSASVEALAGELVEALASAWRRGERPIAEDFLALHPELRDHPDAAINVVYEEVCQRRECGEAVNTVDVVRRFPNWQSQLEILFDCDRILLPHPPETIFPEIGETLGEFRLLAHLGKGARGCTFLATQPTLADRPVVLKVTPCDLEEHLSLARLQHTHIVPLYFLQEFPGRNLRALCMPYLGGATLEHLLETLCDRPTGRRTGRDLLFALDRAQGSAGVALPATGPSREFLARASYVQAVCWVGACLAEALKYAHDRGLVHMDVKPSNILLAIDGQPMLLDFHLARSPIQPDAPAPEWTGGTPRYMSPEQWAAMASVQKGQAPLAPVDGRSDIYALGRCLDEALGGCVTQASANSTNELRGPVVERRRSRHPFVSVGLGDIVQKCLARDAGDRYVDAGVLAEDLRRHMADLPLRGVPNRSPLERWRKWRRRQPHALSQVRWFLAMLIALAGAGLVIRSALFQPRLTEAEAALREAEQAVAENDSPRAMRVLTRGLALVEGVPGSGRLSRALEARLRLAAETEDANRLHEVVEQLRFVQGNEEPSLADMHALDHRVRSLWDLRGRFAHLLTTDHDLETLERTRTDLIDLAIIGATLRIGVAPPEHLDEVRRRALATLGEVEAICGSSLALLLERRRLAESLGLVEIAREASRRASRQPPRSAWDHYAEGLSSLRAGDLSAAQAALDRSLELQPHAFWANFYRGVCAFRLGRNDDALLAFGICVALAPESAECIYQRALAHGALGHTERAIRDYDLALARNPKFAAAFLNRGILYLQEKRHGLALEDLRHALACGADPATIYYNEGLVHLARHDRPAALASLEQALSLTPCPRGARVLFERLRREP